MKINEKTYDGGILSAVIQTEKFKRSYFSMLYTLPLTEENASVCSVLAGVMERGCKKYPTVLDINRRLCSLYDANIGVYCSSFGGTLTLRVSSSVILDRYALETGTDILGGALEMISEMLFSPLAENGELDARYTESEKKRTCDFIRAEKNNKDRLALKRAVEIAYEGTPYAIGAKGSVESVSAVTPKKLYDMLKMITEEAPLYTVYSGPSDEKTEKKLAAFHSELSNKRSKKICLSAPETPIPPLFGEEKVITETCVAKQGRMVLNMAFPPSADQNYAAMIFDEIFGASPTSRLFTNVRERLSLCYYCSSSVSPRIGRMTVRSGLELSNREKALNEINRQLFLLSDPKNISAEELEIAKASKISRYTELRDSGSQYADWYLLRRFKGYECRIDKMIDGIKQVDADSVAAIAASLKPQLSYFLQGTEE